VTWRQPLASRGDLRAAFTGAPAATFDLSPVDPAARAIARLVQLGGGERWAWQLQLDAQAGRDAASASLVRLFR
jgi:hypothetical protein